MADFKDFIRGFATTALANKGFDFRGVLANKEKKGNKLDPNIEKANKLVDLGEEPFGNHTYFYNKGGKYYSTGFDNDEDKEVSVDEMAKIYDDYIAKQK